ncbi:MAG: DUF1552 domain-containing protein [Pseudomonadota bacterium]
MQPERHAHAAPPPAKRFIAVFTPGGTVLENWRPTGTENDFALSPILQPLAPVRERVLVVDGVDMKSAIGEQNQSGIVAWLTGTRQAASGFAGGPSIDQVLASQLSAGLRFPSMELALRWGTGKAHGRVSPIDIANYANSPTFDPIAPRLDPQAVWQQLFGSSPALPADSAWDKSILDAVTQRYQKLEQRLGAADRQRLDAHLTQLRELEIRLPTVANCAAPARVDTSDYNPAAGLMSSDDGSVMDLRTDGAIPTTGKFMMDMLVMALACDLTRVGTLLWGDTEAKYTFPWLGLPQHLDYYMNDGGYQPAACTKIFTWYATQHAYLLQQLMATPGVAGASLLDESVVFFGSNLQHPATHAKTDMPFLLAGGGGLRTNRWLSCGHASHNDLLVSILNACGDARQTFGEAQFCTGPLAGLT